ncbi:MAG: copper oxidase [Nitrospirota bacterium]
MKTATRSMALLLVATAIALAGAPAATAAGVCERTITADVVALDQPFFYNRLGAVNPAGMIFALRRDVVDASGVPLTAGGSATAGAVSLRPDKRPRPIVLRMNEGDCLQINFQNLLAPALPALPDPRGDQPATRTASVHVLGMQPVNSINDDGSYVGSNPNSLVAPGGTATYTLRAEREGTFLLYNAASTVGGEGNGGSLPFGLFGAVNVQKRGAEWYRSQATREELDLATLRNQDGAPRKTPDGHPVIDYDALYPGEEPYLAEGKAGLPILKMLHNDALVHTDINAIITGPNRGNFPAGTYPRNDVLVPARTDDATPRSRLEPYREFTVIFHDEIFAKQAFPEFTDPILSHTLHGVRDGFAINYGTAGAGAEVLANRKNVGPMWDCPECKFEEFFLTSWAVGDPAMVVDIPANAADGTGQVITGPKATVAFYPDDPSNVHHSYIGDHVKFRNLHAGPKEHHIFHLHAHQWLFSPDDDDSSYLDSQAIGPGSGYTYDIAYNGSGNRNQTVGDSIFHCHFYPHFAQGMWELWRVHDVFEAGTELDSATGAPLPGARALPDAEILAGTPIPAVVPLPHRAMAPMPGALHIDNTTGQVVFDDTTRNPGYPFYIPGLAGHRPPHPPLDFAKEADGTVHDGGLPRHIITGGVATFPTTVAEMRLNLDKVLHEADAIQIPESGTPMELLAMNFHAKRFHNSYLPNGAPATGTSGFKTNGRPPAQGAPFADPCLTDFGTATGNRRTYKAAAIQLDMTFNKVGWHFPQSRILALWRDVEPTLNGTRAPEPLFFRANTNDCMTFLHTNLVPNIYELDDYQVRTPTDIIGQHIHLVKFDVTSSDGSGNGYNYEDGTFSPQEVRERIHAINQRGGLWLYDLAAQTTLAAKPHPFFGSVPGVDALGAQTTVQRWYEDPTLNNRGQDRTLRTIFTHDHFGPSTHQQAGLYASLVVEPAGSRWRDPETGTFYGTRDDGGPTSWRADILPRNSADSYREFLFQFADFQLAYQAGSGGTAASPVPDPEGVINPPAKEEAPLPLLVKKLVDVCPDGVSTPPCPEAISAADVGTFTVNYRNEPVALRVLDPGLADLANPAGKQALGRAGDLSLVYRSDVARAIPGLNVQPAFYPPRLGVTAGDPYTPLLRTYDGDKIQIRVQVGATEEGHTMTFHGLKWFSEPLDAGSGYRNAQMLGISEHFELLIPMTPTEGLAGPFRDYLYKMDASSDGQWNGIWGFLRSYSSRRNDLLPLPNNPAPANGVFLSKITNLKEFRGVCPIAAPLRTLDVTAVSAANALPGGTLTYNSRDTQFTTAFDPEHPEAPAEVRSGPLHDPTAILYVRTSDLNADGTLKAGAPVEPLILRARAGECLQVILRNRLPQALPDMDGYSILPPIVDDFNANQVHPSNSVGLHPQLVAFDVARHDGTNAGLNAVKVQTAAPGRAVVYRWYAGDLAVDSLNRLKATPIEFGPVNLMPADPIKQAGKGAVGALVIEHQNATWIEDPGSRASATVSINGVTHREFVLMFQDDINLKDGFGNPIENFGGDDDAEDSAQKAFNYRTEPLWFRLGVAPNLPLREARAIDFTNVLSNTITGGADPQTPVFEAEAGMPVRLYLLHPGGHPRNSVFQLHGHIWDRHPHSLNSTQIGHNHDNHSEMTGSQEGIGPANHFVVLPHDGAGGAFKVPGDYLYRDMASFQFSGGLWGILRVTPPAATPTPE